MLEVTVVNKSPSAVWNAETISVNESSDAASTFEVMKSTCVCNDASAFVRSVISVAKLADTVEIEFAFASSAARAVVASVVIAVVFASSAIPARVASSEIAVVLTPSAANARSASAFNAASIFISALASEVAVL